jgi:hypothetical protein
VSGANVPNPQGVYGTQGSPAASNVPGGRDGAVSWTDAAGTVWLFGGGYDTAGTESYFSDLWTYASGQWTWVGGPNVVNPSGVYGTLGSAAPANVPGARKGAATWTDASGAFWLFGGAGYDSAGNEGELNDLWRYASGQWTWMSGANVVNQTGVYGALGSPGATNVPGARGESVGWTDGSGKFWVFGGYETEEMQTLRNDMWMY